MPKVIDFSPPSTSEEDEHKKRMQAGIDRTYTQRSIGISGAGAEIGRVASSEIPGFATSHPMARAYASELAANGIQPVRDRIAQGVPADPERLAAAQAQLQYSTAARQTAQQAQPIQPTFGSHLDLPHSTEPFERRQLRPEEQLAIKDRVMQRGNDVAAQFGQEPLDQRVYEESPEGIQQAALNERRAAAGLKPLGQQSEKQKEFLAENDVKSLDEFFVRRQKRRLAGQDPDTGEPRGSASQSNGFHPGMREVTEAQAQAQVEDARWQARYDAMQPERDLDNQRADQHLQLAQQRHHASVQASHAKQQAEQAKQQAKDQSEKQERDSITKANHAVIESYRKSMPDDFDDTNWRIIAESGAVSAPQMALMLDRLRYDENKEDDDPSYNELAQLLPVPKRPNIPGTEYPDTEAAPPDAKIGFAGEQTDAQIRYWASEGKRRIGILNNSDRTATNPQTGQRIYHHDGKWVDENGKPVQ